MAKAEGSMVASGLGTYKFNAQAIILNPFTTYWVVVGPNESR